MSSTYIEARRQQLQLLVDELIKQEEAAMIRDLRPRRAFVPCPENIGNDPCDDWDLHAEEYD